MHSNRSVKKYPEIRMDVAAVAMYAKGSAPYIGVPVVEDGTRRAAVFCRKHLQAAIAAPVVSAVYDVEAHTLTLNGGPLAKYTLRDLAADGLSWQMRNDLTKWAERKRKTATVKNLPANLKQDAKRREAIGKLERRLSKIYLYKPFNPVCAERRERWDGSAVWMRDQVAEWTLQKPHRKALGRIYGRYVADLYKPRGRFPWKSVNADIEAAGMRLDSYNAWSKVRTRVAHKGMDIPEYLKSLPEFVGLVRKPWDLKPLEFESRRENYVRELQSYFAAKSEADSLKAQIANLKLATKPLALELAEAS
jgi:hypothetical protein